MCFFPFLAIRPVKVLGILCMIDEGECGWKVVVIDVDDKWAPFMNNISDVEEQLSGILSAIGEWYYMYKIPDGTQRVWIARALHGQGVCK